MYKKNLQKLIIFFSCLGIIAFILTAFSGSLVWLKTNNSCEEYKNLYTYNIVENSLEQHTQIIESYLRCAESHNGLRSVLIHLTLKLVLFLISL